MAPLDRAALASIKLERNGGQQQGGGHGPTGDSGAAREGVARLDAQRQAVLPCQQHQRHASWLYSRIRVRDKV